jgi:hypothetical protein
VTNIDETRKTLAALEAKHAELEDRKAELEDQRDDVAYDAHCGDEKARAKLTKLSRELIEIDMELASLSAACRTAEERVAEAQGHERAAIERKKGEEALGIGSECSPRTVPMPPTRGGPVGTAYLSGSLIFRQFPSIQ